MYATRNALQGRVGSTSAMSPAGFEPLEARTLLSVDFVAAFINADSHTLAPNEDFTAAMVVNNDGNEQSPGYSVEMRLSSDGVFGNADDIVLGIVDRPTGIAGDSSTSIVRTFSIPGDADPGSYFLAFSVDPSDAVAETSENNNVVFSLSQLITITPAGGGNVDLDVFGNGHEILDGAHEASQDDHTYFGDIEVGQSQDRVFTLMNDGSGTLQILDITIAGVDNLDFVVVSSRASSIGAGQSMNITIRFAPLAEGSRVGSIEIQTNDTDDGTGDPSSFTFAVSGEGHDRTATPSEIEIRGNGQIIQDGDVSPAFGDHTSFGRLRLADAALTRTFTVYNTGGTTLDISGIEIIGRNADQFTLLDNIDSIAPGDSATFRVRFDPSSLGQKTAQVRLFSGDADEGEYNFKLSGRGAVNGGPGDALPEIDVRGNGLSITDGDTSASTLDDTAFGRVRFNDQTRTRTYTIHNTGTASLDIDAISIFGRDASNFVLLDQPTVVDAGSSATFRVRFDPDGLGNRRADIRILSNDANEGDYTFRVRGNGVNTPSGGGQGEITVAGLLLIEDGDVTAALAEGTHFGTVSSGQSVTRTFTITNTGTDVLNLTGPFVQISGGNAARFAIIQMPDSTLGVGEVTTFTVRFTPNSAGLRRATVEILSDDQNEAVFNFDIVGRGRVV